MPLRSILFQSTYLYKVRQDNEYSVLGNNMFQSTYLYKVRQRAPSGLKALPGFQSTYLYKVRPQEFFRNATRRGFQSTYLYKVRPILLTLAYIVTSFNPRTYIRYDVRFRHTLPIFRVSIHVPI